MAQFSLFIESGAPQPPHFKSRSPSRSSFFFSVWFSSQEQILSSVGDFQKGKAKMMMMMTTTMMGSSTNNSIGLPIKKRYNLMGIQPPPMVTTISDSMEQKKMEEEGPIDSSTTRSLLHHPTSENSSPSMTSDSVGQKMESLLGHPKSDYCRAIQPNPITENTSLLMISDSIGLQEQEEVQIDYSTTSDLIHSLPSCWSVTAKRGTKARNFSSKSSLPTCSVNSEPERNNWKRIQSHPTPKNTTFSMLSVSDSIMGHVLEIGSSFNRPQSLPTSRNVSSYVGEKKMEVRKWGREAEIVSAKSVLPRWSVTNKRSSTKTVSANSSEGKQISQVPGAFQPPSTSKTSMDVCEIDSPFNLPQSLPSSWSVKGQRGRQPTTFASMSASVVPDSDGPWELFIALLNAGTVMQRQMRQELQEKQKIRKGKRKLNNGDDDRVFAYTTITKKKKKTISGSNNRSILLQSQPMMPLHMRESINAMTGIHVQYVYRKSISTTDVNRHHGRLTMPKENAEQVLTHSEIEHLGKKDGRMQVLVLDPKCRELDMTFRLWPSINRYAFITKWNELVAANDIRKDCHVVDVWSFRRRKPGQGGYDYELCFAINIVRHDSCGTSSTSGATSTSGANHA